jgi:uncharacterized protein (TIGR00266 family)
MNYKILDSSTPAVTCELSPGESMITQSGAMAWMSPNMEMQTAAGGLGKAFGRLFSGESVFLNTYSPVCGPGSITFASSFPGTIRAVEITPDKPLIIQKSAFLAATSGVDVSVVFQQKARVGFFGGEGFIMQRLSGRGLAFIEIDGQAVDHNLLPGEQLIVDTGYLACMDSSCNMDIRTVRGVKNALFGGEGLFHTVVTGPGHVVLQTMSVVQFTARIAASIPSKD